MSIRSLTLRFLILWFVLAFPFALFGGIVFGVRGASVGGLAVLMALLGVAILCEKLWLRRLKAERNRIEGLSYTLKKALQFAEPSLGFPKVAVFEEAYPYVVIARSLLSSGSIFLSQGAIASLSENELRFVFQVSTAKLQNSETLFESLCGIFLSGCSSWAPYEWIEFYCSPGSNAPKIRPASVKGVIWFLMWVPLIDLMIHMSRPDQESVKMIESDWSFGALQKLGQGGSIALSQKGINLVPLSSSVWCRTAKVLPNPYERGNSVNL